MGSLTRSIGNVLFRFRSFTPVPVIAALAWVLWRSRESEGPGGASVDVALNFAGLATAFLGQALRFFTLGWVTEGTSGQGSSLEAKVLNTRGPYAWVRNPLYVGNLGIVLGLLLVAHDVGAYALGLGFFFGEYFFIIRAEEAFLRDRFGADFDAYCERVWRWVPRPPSLSAGRLRDGRFDTQRAFFKEHNPFAAWTLGLLSLWAWEAQARRGVSPEGWAALGAVAACIVLGFVVVKTQKRRWYRRQRELRHAQTQSP